MILNSIKIVTFFLCFDMLIFATHQKRKNPRKILIYRDFLCFTILSSGETGIRTPDTLLGYTRFPGVPLQPLEHLSFFRSAKIEQIFKTSKYLSPQSI